MSLSVRSVAATLLSDMKREEWKKEIIRACKTAKTYRPFFDNAIEQLAGILEMRDDAEEQYRKSGNSPVIKHTNKAGHANLTKNPALVVINECNQQALAYWRDLGLTPAGYKKLNTGELSEHDNTFEEMLAKVGI